MVLKNTQWNFEVTYKDKELIDWENENNRKI